MKRLIDDLSVGPGKGTSFAFYDINVMIGLGWYVIFADI